MPKPLSLILSAEHITHELPDAYRPLFVGKETVLLTHRGWDPGTADLLEELQRHGPFPHLQSEVSRLLVELNRSPDNPEIFSPFTASLSMEARAKLLSQYYNPYITSLTSLVEKEIARGMQVVHLGLHSFTPIWNEAERPAEIGLLFDPSRKDETDFCNSWAEALQKARPGWRIKSNFPYWGTDDGLTTYLRQHYPAEDYLGLEIEVNQKLYLNQPKEHWKDDVAAIAKSLIPLLSHRG